MLEIKMFYEKYNGIEKYLNDENLNNKYIKRGQHELYAFDDNKKTEIYAKDKNENQFYAKRNENEVYAIALGTSFEFFIKLNDTFIYAKDKFGNERYPKFISRKDRVAQLSEDKYYYAKLSNKDEYYPKDENDHEYIYHENRNLKFAVLSNGLPIVPRYSNGDVKYSLKLNTEQVYEYNGQIFYAKDMAGNEIYPKDEFKNEYYPSDTIYAKDASGLYIYAIDHKKSIVYPKDINGKEFYFQGLDTYSSLKPFLSYFYRYIQGSYPQKLSKYGLIDVIIQDKYAENENGEFYPKDSNNNEYVNNSGDIIKSLGYPVTNDGYIILPNKNNEPLGDEKIQSKIICLLYRPDTKSYDFLTSIKTTRTFPTKRYETLSINNTSWVNFVLVLIFFLALLLISLISVF